MHPPRAPKPLEWGHEPVKTPMSWEFWLLALFHVVLAPWTVVHALLTKRESRAAFGWIAVCVIFTVAGPLLYLLFGVNRVRTRARRLATPFELGFERGEHHPERAVAPRDLGLPGDLVRVGNAISRFDLAPGNQIRPLINGETAYPAMIRAIEQASERVWLISYIFDAGEIGSAFVDVLAEAAERGVDVRVIIDGVGEWYSLPRVGKRLQRRGIRFGRFLPPRLLPPSLSLNMRNHHKILITDRNIAFTGGMNIGDRHLVERRGRDRVADMHFRLQGPVVGQLAEVFLDSWQFVTGNRDAPEQRPAPEPAGETIGRTITDGPDADLDKLTMLFSSAISLARDSIEIMTPYFLPPREIIGALQAAALRGVNVRIVLPETNNLPYVHWATRNMLWEVVYWGCEVHYQPGPFNHSKLLVTDRAAAVIGSANWDARSLRLNFELGVELFDKTLAGELSDHIRQRAAAGRPITLEELDGRGLPARLRDAVCWLFAPYL